MEAAPSGFFSKVEPGTDAAGRIGVFTCPAESSCLTSAPLNGPTQVIAASGSVNVAIDGRQRQLRQGMECRLEANESIVEAPRVDVVLAESWMQPLLTLKGHGNPELSKRVDNLLAEIGRAKLSVLYERQIRSLGEYGALPLLQFVRSEESSNDRERRRAGMRILKDIAPVWITPELIGLLEDTDTEVRVDAAQALERLHGVKFGLSAEDWKNSENTRSESIAKWKSWWSENRSGVAPPPAEREIRIIGASIQELKRSVAMTTYPPGARCMSAIRSSGCSMPTETRSVLSVMPGFAAGFERHRRVAHRLRIFDQRLDAAQRFGQLEQLRSGQERVRPPAGPL